MPMGVIRFKLLSCLASATKALTRAEVRALCGIAGQDARDAIRYGLQRGQIKQLENDSYIITDYGRSALASVIVRR